MARSPTNSEAAGAAPSGASPLLTASYMPGLGSLARTGLGARRTISADFPRTAGGLYPSSASPTRYVGGNYSPLLLRPRPATVCTRVLYL